MLVDRFFVAVENEDGTIILDIIIHENIRNREKAIQKAIELAEYEYEGQKFRSIGSSF